MNNANKYKIVIPMNADSATLIQGQEAKDVIKMYNRRGFRIKPDKKKRIAILRSENQANLFSAVESNKVWATSREMMCPSIRKGWTVYVIPTIPAIKTCKGSATVLKFTAQKNPYVDVASVLQWN